MRKNSGAIQQNVGSAAEENLIPAQRKDITLTVMKVNPV
jgi:hypothetical protein